MNIRVQISRMVLHGVDPRDRRAFQVAVQEELSRLLAQRGLPGALTLRRDSVTGPAVDLSADARDLGTGVARSVYRTIDPSGGRK